MAIRRRSRRYPLSSAHPLLRGMSFDGKKVQAVYRGPGTRRIIRFTDGTQKQTHRRAIAELAKLQGLLKYRARYLKAKGPQRAAMLQKSEARQQAILRNYKKRLQAELGAMPEPLRASLIAHLTRLERGRFGSPLVGKTPATSLIAGRPQETFRSAARAGVTFRTIGKGKDRRVIPIRA